MMRDPPLKFKSKAKKGTMKGSKEHSEIFDVGDTVYSVSEFEKVRSHSHINTRGSTYSLIDYLIRPIYDLDDARMIRFFGGTG